MNVAVMVICPNYHKTYGRFDHVLLLHETNGQWGLPCGPIGDSETPERAARRLVLEQTGYLIDSELIPCDSEDENCTVFSAEVSEDFKPQRTELHDNDMWPCPDFARDCSPAMYAPGVIAALNSNSINEDLK